MSFDRKNKKDRVQQLLAEMSLEEKASLCSGHGFWHLKDIDRLGLPAIMIADGPHGLRKCTAADGSALPESAMRHRKWPAEEEPVALEGLGWLANQASASEP